MKKTNRFFSILALAATSLSLVSCSSEDPNKLSTPKNFIFDPATGNFSFDAVKGAETYVVGVSLILNDTTGERLQQINASSKVQIDSKTTKYVWSNQMGSATGIADDDGDGKITGSVIFRTFSSSATDAGTPIDASEIPTSHYIATAMASATAEKEESDPAYYQFTKEGKLDTPNYFFASIDDSNLLNLTVPSGNKTPFASSGSNGYYLDSLTTTGLPDYLSIQVLEAGTEVETFKVDDFSFTNTINGPMKMFVFNNAVIKGTKALDKTKEHIVKIQAIGSDGVSSSDVATALWESSTPETKLSTAYDCSGSGKRGEYTINVKVGLTESGEKTYTLDVVYSNHTIYRESGTYTVPEGVEVTVADEKNTYPDGTVLTFKTTQSDLAEKVLDGKTLTVTRKEAINRGWGGEQKTISYVLAGTGLSLKESSDSEAVTFDLDSTVSTGGQGGPGGGPGGF